MDSQTSHTWTTPRIVALGLIGLTVVGLMYLRLGPDDSVSLPPGAEVGDLYLEDCVYATEHGPYQAECGTLIVAENGSDPQSRLIALPVTRIPARSDSPTEPIFRLEGGPGQTNMAFPQASRYTEDHDVVLVGYRGVDGSVRLDCPEVETALRRSTDFLGAESMEAYGDGLRSCAERLTGEGLDVASYGLVQQVDDLEAARVAFGYARVNLLSESAGTRTAMIYSWRYPESIHRSVMFGVNPPGHFLWDGDSTDEQLGRYTTLCSKDPDCRVRTDDLAASIQEIAAGMPDRWLFLPIKGGNVSVASFIFLMQGTSETGIQSAPAVFDSWLSAHEGDASGLWVTSVLADVMLPNTFVWGQYAAAAHIDAEAAYRYFSGRGQETAGRLGRAATAFAWGGGSLVDSWPSVREESQYAPIRATEVNTLLISGELDTSTPPQVANRELLPYLPNGQEVVLQGFVHSPSFWSDQPEANAHLILTFFESGEVDDSLYQPQPVDFTPPLTLGAVARIALGVIVGLAALSVLSLLATARRVRTRGRLEPMSGALLRSVHPLLLGLGGWCLGVLIVLTAMPAVRIDNGPLSVISVAVPVGLGVYLAWVHRDWSRDRKSAGLVGAVLGALLGAWFGFNTVEGLGSLLTTLVAAIAGANLALIGLDIVRASSRARAAASPPTELVPERVRP